MSEHRFCARGIAFEPARTPTAMITVNNQPFFGRVEEQKQFRTTLADLRITPPHETLPFVVLLFGDGGIGKTTLTSRFRDIVRGEFRGQFQGLWVDWEDERRMAPRLQVGREHIGADAIFESLYAIARRAGWEKPFARSRSERQQRAAVTAPFTAPKTMVNRRLQWPWAIPSATSSTMCGCRSGYACGAFLGSESLSRMVAITMPLRIGSASSRSPTHVMLYSFYSLRLTKDAVLRHRDHIVTLHLPERARLVAIP